jgi:hypothetical protein
LSDLLKKESPAMPGFLVSPIGRITSVDRASMQPACQRPAEERAWSRSAQGSSGFHWSSVAIDCSQYFLSRNGKKVFSRYFEKMAFILQIAMAARGFIYRWIEIYLFHSSLLISP